MKKMNLMGLCFLLFATMFLSSCDEINCPNATGDQMEKTFDFTDFDELEFDLGCDIIITQADEFSVTVSGREEILDDLLVNKQGDKLSFDIKECYDNFDQTIIRISLPDLEKIESDGSSDIQSENVWALDNLDIRLDGSGDLDLSLDVAYLEIVLDGSGDVDLEGQATDVRYEIDGSGDISAFDLDSEDVDLKIDGSGDAELRASESLKIDLDGSGDVYYKGQPVLDVSIDGSGEVVNAN